MLLLSLQKPGYMFVGAYSLVSKWKPKQLLSFELPAYKKHNNFDIEFTVAHCVNGDPEIPGYLQFIK